MPSLPAPTALRSNPREKKGGAVDTHGGRDQWMCVFVYVTDHATEPAQDREPMKFTEVYLGEVKTVEFRNNPRGDAELAAGGGPSNDAARRSQNHATLARRSDAAQEANAGPRRVQTSTLGAAGISKLRSNWVYLAK